MTRTPSGRLAAAGLIALVVSAAPAAGGEILHRLLHHEKHCAEKQRVTLPAREIEVVTEQPRVMVRDATPHHHHRVLRRDLGMVPLSTVYLPMSLPMVPAFAGTTRGECEVERNPLEEQLLTVLRGERARAQIQATMDIHNRAIQQVGGTAIERATHAQIEQKLNQMATELKNMNERLTAVEKLLIYHDNFLTNQGRGAADAKPGTVPSRAPQAPATSQPEAPPMIPPLPPPAK